MPTHSDVEHWNARLLSRDDLARLKHTQTRLARARGLIYLDDATVRVIELLLRPRLVTHAQRTYIHRVAAAVAQVQQNAARAWLDDARVRRALPLEPGEAELFTEVARSPLGFVAPVVSRLDASLAAGRASWKRDLRLFELNSVGIGRLALVPIAESVARDLTLPLLDGASWGARAGPDQRETFCEVFRLHARRLGISRPRIALVEDRAEPGGTQELDDLARVLRASGLRAHAGEVRELTLEAEQLVFMGRPVDLVYRDAEAVDLFELRGMAKARAAFGWGFRHGRVVSSIVGDLDHKSLWELLTDEALRHLVPRRARTFLSRHALWTRLIYPRRTDDATGRRVDLEALLRRGREALVLKPNRAYGGVGVTVGLDTTGAKWERTIERAFTRPGTWVVQALGEVVREGFPVPTDDGPRRVEHFVDCGVYRLGAMSGSVLSRAARRRIVNVSSGGGMAAVLYRR